MGKRRERFGRKAGGHAFEEVAIGIVEFFRLRRDERGRKKTQLFNNVIFCDTIFFTSESRNMLLEDISRYELFIENHSSCNHLVGRISRFYVLLAGFYTQILSSGISTAASINVLY